MKRTYVANFNLVFFGEKEEPLLAYLDTVVMPALTSKKKRTSGDAKYFLMDVEITEAEDGEYVLKGVLVKQTILEVKSDLDEKGNLIEKDEKYPTAPFSMFVICLKNHRMIYVQNQKGSPSLDNFKATIKWLLNNYVNDKAKEDKEYPIPILNVVGIPMRKKLKEALEDVEKINTLCLRFYPLNGDIDYSGIFGGISRDIRGVANSKRADLIIKSPQNVKGVIDIVEQSSGTVEPIFSVTYKDKSNGKKRKGKIKNEEISESMQIEIQGENIDEEIRNIIAEGKKISSINYTSECNAEIYDKHQAKIIKFLQRK